MFRALFQQLRLGPLAAQLGSIPRHGKRFMANLPGQSQRKRHQNYFLRQRRKWPLSDFKTEFDLRYAQRLALTELRKSLKSLSLSHSHSHSQPPPDFPKLLLHSFSSYESQLTPNAYRFLIRFLIKNPSFWDQIPKVLQGLQEDATFQTPELALIDLINFYGKSDMLETAIQIFYDIPKFRCNPSVESLNALLVQTCKRKQRLEFVPEILMRSGSMKIRMEESTFRILITALCKNGSFKYAIELVHLFVSEGNVVKESLYSFVVSKMCRGKGSDKVEILGFLEKMKGYRVSPREVDWCNVIRYFVENGKRKDALEAFDQMISDRVQPSVSCYNLVLKCSVKESLYDKADELFDNMLVSGLVPDIYTYNAFISGLCRQNKLEEGVNMLVSMERLGCRPNRVTYNIVLQGICMVGKLNMAKEILRQMTVKGMDINMETSEIMIGGMISGGDFDDAFDFLKEKVENCSCAHSIALDKMICALCLRDSLDKAVEVLQVMVQKNIAPGVEAWKALLEQSKISHSLFEIP